jgi:hypothetical protein
MNGTSCWGIVLKDGTTTHVHADRVWVEGGSLFFAEERENPDVGRLHEPETCMYVTMAFATGEWLRTFAASIVDGAPLPVVQYGDCETSAPTQGRQRRATHHRDSDRSHRD